MDGFSSETEARFQRIERNMDFIAGNVAKHDALIMTMAEKDPEIRSDKLTADVATLLLDTRR
jgi:hypothetical protein